MPENRAAVLDNYVMPYRGLSQPGVCGGAAEWIGVCVAVGNVMRGH